MRRVNTETPVTSVTPPPKTVKPRHSNKAPSVKAQVISKRIQGEPIAKIARDTGISRPTVYTIINEADLDTMFADGRVGVMKRVPQALQTLDVRLDKNSETAALWLLNKCFDNQQPTGNRLASDLTLNQTLNVLLHSDPAPAEPAEASKLKSSVISEIEIQPTDK